MSWTGSLLIIAFFSHAFRTGSARYHEATCRERVANSEWRRLRLQSRFVGNEIQSESLRRLREVVVPALGEYLESSLRIRDGVEQLRFDTVCASRRFGLCVERGNEQMRCGARLIYSELLEPLEIYDCPPEAEGPESCVLNVLKTEQVPGGKKYVKGTDLVLNFAAKPNWRFCGNGAIAYSSVCSESACGRPTMGSIILCEPEADNTDEVWIHILLHEIVHILGFRVGNGMNDWINSDGTLQLAFKDRVELIFQVDTDESGRLGNLRILESLPPFLTSSSRIHVRSIPYRMVKSITARGVGQQCSCPVDPSTTFTDSSLTKCLLQDGIRECVFVIATPRVLAETKSYFGCDSVLGMELENRDGPDGGFVSGAMFNSHWKYKNIHPELMNAVWSPDPPMVSRMTLALLEDSGWYQVDYERAATRFGDAYGHHFGCRFLSEHCDEYNEYFFNPRDRRDPDIVQVKGICSADTFTRLVDSGPSVPSSNRVNNDLMEHCHTYDNKDGELCSKDWPIPSPNNSKFDIRCLVRSDTASETPICYGIQCAPNRKSYFVYDRNWDFPIFECRREGFEFIGRSRAGADLSLNCRDPAVVCAQLSYPHFPSSDIQGVPEYQKNYILGATESEDHREKKSRIDDAGPASKRLSLEKDPNAD